MEGVSALAFTIWRQSPHVNPEGVDLATDAIAKRAGVGAGKLYRHVGS